MSRFLGYCETLEILLSSKGFQKKKGLALQFLSLLVTSAKIRYRYTVTALHICGIKIYSYTTYPDLTQI